MHKLSLVTIAVMACSPAFAVEPNGWYAGANIGRSTGDFERNNSIGPFVGAGYGALTYRDSDKDTGYKLYGGYRMSRNFALEGGYFNLGKFNYDYTTSPFGTFGGSNHAHGLNLDLVGIVPLGDRFSVFGKVGAAYIDERTEFFRTGGPPVTGNHGDFHVRPKFGIGAQYQFTDRLSVRAELERYRFNDPVRRKSNIDMASVGLVYYFGAPPRVIQTVAPAPVYVAPPPPPPPRVVAPPPPPPPPPPTRCVTSLAPSTWPRSSRSPTTAMPCVSTSRVSTTSNFPAGIFPTTPRRPSVSKWW